MVAWSPARSSLLRHCPRQYMLRHVLKAAPAQPDSAARMRGRVVHAGLAAAFAARVDHELGDPGYPQMARYYPAAERAMYSHPDTPKLSVVAGAEARAEVYAVLKTITPSHPAAILGVEMPFTVAVDGEQLTGVVDLALRTGPTSAHIREWKTGTVDWEPLSDDALPLYGGVAVHRWPWIETVTIGLYSTRTGREQVQTLTLDQTQALRRRLVADAMRERAARAQLSVDTADTLFPTTPGAHCGSCPFRSYCPLFRGVAGLPVRPGVDPIAEGHRLAQMLER